MNALLSLPKQLKEYRNLLSSAQAGQVASVYGAAPVHRAHLIAALADDLPEKTVCVLCRDEQAARTFAGDLRAFGAPDSAILPCRDLIFHSVEGVSREYEQQRLNALWRIRTGESHILCAPADAMLMHTLPPQALEQASFTVESDGAYDVDELASHLVQAGYTRSNQVEGPGQFALRGGILDIFPVGAEAPVRVEFFGDEVDSLSAFDPLTQRRTEA